MLNVVESPHSCTQLYCTATAATQDLLRATEEMMYQETNISPEDNKHLLMCCV